MALGARSGAVPAAMADGSATAAPFAPPRLRGFRAPCYTAAVHFPRVLRRVNRVFTNPLLGTIAWVVPPLALLHHRGRRTGRTYRTPVVAFRSARGFVVPMTYGR